MKASRLILAALAATITAVAVAQTPGTGAGTDNPAAAPSTPSPPGLSDQHSGGGEHRDRAGHRRHNHCHHAHGKQASFAGRWLKRVDTDGDGQLSLDEFKAMQKRQLEAFERADTDHDGKLSPEEMRASRRAMRHSHRGEHHRADSGGSHCSGQAPRKSVS